jgi:hypothetical protein
MDLDGQAVVGRPARREPCYQEPVACRPAAHLASGQGSLWEVERQVLQTYGVAVLEGWEKWRLAVVGSGL